MIDLLLRNACIAGQDTVTDIAVDQGRITAAADQEAREVIDLGGKRIRHIDTPHVPHNWEARVLFEETTRTLLCGDLFTHTGDGPALTDSDIVGPALAAEELFHATALTVVTASTIRRLATLEPQLLALMHGSSTRAHCSEALVRLAEAYELMVRQREK